MGTVKKMTVAQVRDMLTLCTRKINLVVIHCSATPLGRDVSGDDIRRWHVDDRGFADIGYHFVVRLDGSVEAGRPLNRIGAHCRGHNAASIGVCYIGGLDSLGHPADTRTEAQKSALIALLRAIRSRFPSAAIRGHRDFAPKACPCFPATEEYSML